MSDNREVFNAEALAEPGKRVILVNGIPASGKSSLAVELSVKTGWLQLSLDGIKNPFLQRIEGVDRAFNRRLGQASYQVIWSIVADAPQGSTFIVDAWFGFQPKEVLVDYLTQAGVTDVLEIWCQISSHTAGARYEARLGERVAGHLGAEYIPELKILAEKAQPMELGPVYYSDQEKPVDIDAIKQWVNSTFK
ncbi:AAA family ATPase [Rouxiella silvae]|uniref:AAA family ATPase n=1 Tax=Rouxiella silvae TaxID=1646373 RepID=A0AA41BXX5_9GAMM|nr:AAA family ATPase [Rouxiella silvae]MBF6638414.1 AAA family ATPase [Rouxiella silvae]ORJ18792.1 AAA family ATPase [Rouxiella silvae]